MGRRSTKENKSIWQVTRENLDLTREKAAELIPGFSPERIEKIENGRTQIQPEDVLLMAEYYKTPSLCNHYCAYECPIGQIHAIRTESKQLGQIAVETLNALNQMNRNKDRLLEIVEDGQVRPDEYRDLWKSRRYWIKLPALFRTCSCGSMNRSRRGTCRNPENELIQKK